MGIRPNPIPGASDPSKKPVLSSEETVINEATNEKVETSSEQTVTEAMNIGSEVVTEGVVHSNGNQEEPEISNELKSDNESTNVPSTDSIVEDSGKTEPIVTTPSAPVVEEIKMLPIESTSTSTELSPAVDISPSESTPVEGEKDSSKTDEEIQPNVSQVESSSASSVVEERKPELIAEKEAEITTVSEENAPNEPSVTLTNNMLGRLEISSEKSTNEQEVPVVSMSEVMTPEVPSTLVPSVEASQDQVSPLSEGITGVISSSEPSVDTSSVLTTGTSDSLNPIVDVLGKMPIEDVGKDVNAGLVPVSSTEITSEEAVDAVKSDATVVAEAGMEAMASLANEGSESVHGESDGSEQNIVGQNGSVEGSPATKQQTEESPSVNPGLGSTESLEITSALPESSSVLSEISPISPSADATPETAKLTEVTDTSSLTPVLSENSNEPADSELVRIGTVEGSPENFATVQDSNDSKANEASPANVSSEVSETSTNVEVTTPEDKAQSEEPKTSSIQEVSTANPVVPEDTVPNVAEKTILEEPLNASTSPKEDLAVTSEVTSQDPSPSGFLEMSLNGSEAPVADSEVSLSETQKPDLEDPNIPISPEASLNAEIDKWAEILSTDGAESSPASETATSGVEPVPSSSPQDSPAENPSTPEDLVPLVNSQGLDGLLAGFGNQQSDSGPSPDVIADSLVPVTPEDMSSFRRK